MPVNILMPALSPTMEKGNLAKWLKKEGDKVKAGDVIAEIETDKATMEYESIDDGMLAKIVVPEGTQDVPVNQLIAVLAEEGEDVKAAAAGGAGRALRCRRKAASPGTPLQSLRARRHRRDPLPAGAARPPPQAPAAPSPRGERVRVRGPGSTAMAPTASSPRRWRGVSPRTPASISRASRAPARTAA